MLPAHLIPGDPLRKYKTPQRSPSGEAGMLTAEGDVDPPRRPHQCGRCAFMIPNTAFLTKGESSPIIVFELKLTAAKLAEGSFERVKKVFLMLQTRPTVGLFEKAAAAAAHSLALARLRVDFFAADAIRHRQNVLNFLCACGQLCEASFDSFKPAEGSPLRRFVSLMRL